MKQRGMLNFKLAQIYLIELSHLLKFTILLFFI